MLEVVIPGQRYGEAIIDTSVAYCGCFCYISGLTSGNYGAVQKLNVPATTANSVKSIYPVNKYYFEEFYNDTSDTVDKLTKGDMIIYYEGGEYITDKWLPKSFGFTSTGFAAIEKVTTSMAGRKAYVPGSSTAVATIGVHKCFVSTGAGNGWGYVVGMYSTATNPHGLPTIATPSGYVGFLTGVYYTDSSDMKARIRIHPGRTVGI